ncbi:hypothetical protein LPTSP3_g25760 [Leptospira kobayashii]|uniref:Lipoprotein n=1 Tax=Leptospira kobayashii TaxID=1917830 RepID=A0ABM7UL39_9LEPT|nr:hypothetical protein [Leptospira kobayashii]BDA79646.1 hypothetical protein LPTSP3_g25760 [Leptospira kobayashii]
MNNITTSSILNPYLVFSSLFIFLTFSCSSPQVVEQEQPKVEKSLPNERAWNQTAQCCSLHSEFLGVVVLNQVCVSQTETKLELFTKESKLVCVLKEGMVFKDDKGNSYSFLKSEGVDLCPKRTRMKNTPFSIYFDSLSPEAKSFDLIENKNAKHAHKPWAFEKVDLSACKWN